MPHLCFCLLFFVYVRFAITANDGRAKETFWFLTMEIVRTGDRCIVCCSSGRMSWGLRRRERLLWINVGGEAGDVWLTGCWNVSRVCEDLVRVQGSLWEFRGVERVGGISVKLARVWSTWRDFCGVLLPSVEFIWFQRAPERVNHPTNANFPFQPPTQTLSSLPSPSYY
jgi:hypothetical protein